MSSSVGLTPASNILAVRVGRAGDMVMITPALRAILEKHPEADVHLLTSADGRRVLRGFDPRVTRTLIYDRRGLSGLLQRRRLQRELAAGAYSHVYCFETNPSYRAMLGIVRGEKRFLERTHDLVPFPERCLRLVKASSPVPMWLALPLAETGRAAARAMLAAAGIHGSDFVIGLHPSYSALGKLAIRAREARRRKTWPLASFAQAALLLADYGARQGLNLRVICDLLPEERALGLELVSEATVW